MKLFVMPFQLLLLIFLVFLTTYTYTTPIIEQGIGSFYCRNKTNIFCCPLLAHRAAVNDVDSVAASIVLTNKSGYRITLVAASLEKGSWLSSDHINCEPPTVPLENGQSEVFSAITTSYSVVIPVQ